MTEQNAAPKNTGQFALQRIYLKNVSFEAPGAPGVFGQEWRPDTQVQFHSGSARVAESIYDVVLRVTVTTTTDGKVAFIAEAEMAGLFLIDGANESQLEHALGVQCPNILFPFVREILMDLVSRGTFPQLLLQPMNFDAMYYEARRRKQAAAEGTPPAH